jgi:UrcA family protein
MNALLAKTANLSLLALAAAPLLAVSLAHAEPAKVRISDLNLDRPADQRTFEARVSKAADQICGSINPAAFAQVQACREAVRSEAVDQLPQQHIQVRASQPANG